VSPFGAPLSTLASDGTVFALLDVKERLFVEGKPGQCHLERFLQIPVPPEALLRLLAGEAPVLVHQPNQSQLNWEGGGYRIDIDSLHHARQVIELEPHPDDWDKAYAEQRVRVKSVEVSQQGYVLYRAEFEDFRSVRTAGPRVDPDGLFADVPPSGPECRAELPHRMRFRIADGSQDLSFKHDHIEHNPPIVGSTFTLARPGGVRREYSHCASE
jgi:hypothetical protein